MTNTKAAVNTAHPKAALPVLAAYRRQRRFPDAHCSNPALKETEAMASSNVLSPGLTAAGTLLVMLCELYFPNSFLTITVMTGNQQLLTISSSYPIEHPVHCLSVLLLLN